MDRQAILERVDRLPVWSRGGRWSRHKPLLVLYAVGRWERGQIDVTFLAAERGLTALLREFDPLRKLAATVSRLLPVDQPTLRKASRASGQVTFPPPPVWPIGQQRAVQQRQRARVSLPARFPPDGRQDRLSRD